MLKRLRIYHIPLIAALVIASVQYVLSSGNTLTRWEGGGFGMYSEPNPHYSRIIWISLGNSHAEFRIRLYPMDKDLENYIENLSAEERKIWDRVTGELKQIRNFPSYSVNDNFLRNTANALLSVESPGTERLRRNKNLNIKIIVNQVNIDLPEKLMISDQIYSKELKL